MKFCIATDSDTSMHGDHELVLDTDVPSPSNMFSESKTWSSISV